MIYSGSEAITYNKPKIYEHSTIYPLKEIIFENQKYTIPNHVESYLDEIYTDWHSFPTFKLEGHNNIQDNMQCNIDILINELKEIERNFIK